VEIRSLKTEPLGTKIIRSTLTRQPLKPGFHKLALARHIAQHNLKTIGLMITPPQFAGMANRGPNRPTPAHLCHQRLIVSFLARPIKTEPLNRHRMPIVQATKTNIERTTARQSRQLPGDVLGIVTGFLQPQAKVLTVAGYLNRTWCRDILLPLRPEQLRNPKILRRRFQFGPTNPSSARHRPVQQPLRILTHWGTASSRHTA